jgi:nitrogen fixation protein
MKKVLVLIFCLTAFAFSSTAQKSVKSMYLPIIIKNDDGSTGSYELKKGDKLVYRVNAGGSEYDFIVTINKETPKGGLDFNYEMTNSNNTKGHVVISSVARSKATKYINYFRGGELNLTDAITVWLSYKNFGDMPDKKTTMQLDNNSPETFYRPEKDEANPVVKIKGEDKKLDAFIINNAADGTGNKTMWINGISSNSLIVKMELGFSIQLMEIK